LDFLNDFVAEYKRGTLLEQMGKPELFGCHTYKDPTSLKNAVKQCESACPG